MEQESIGLFKGLMNEYGLYVPYLFLILIFLALSKVRLKGYLFKKTTEVTTPFWIVKGLTAAQKRNGLINLAIGCLFFLAGYFLELIAAYYIGWFIIGISFAFLSFSVFHYFFPTSKIVSKESKGRIGKNEIFVLSSIAFFLFIFYFQLIWPTFEQDPAIDGEGRIRVIFYMTGMAFYNSMMPLIVLKVGRHRLNVISVIGLISQTLLMMYVFLNYLLNKGIYNTEGYAFSFILAFAFSLLIIDDIESSKKGGEEL